MSQWQCNLNIVQNCANEIGILKDMLRFSKTKKSKTSLEKIATFKFALSFAKTKLKTMYGQIFKVQNNIMGQEVGFSYNRQSIFFFNKPLRWLKVILRKVVSVQTQSMVKYMDNYTNMLELILRDCQVFMKFFVKTLFKYQNMLRFGYDRQSIVTPTYPV